MIAPNASPAHSAADRLSLIVAGRTLPMGRVGPDQLELRVAVDLPPGPAEVLVEIDGRQHRSAVYLIEGASAASPFVLIRDADLGNC